MALRGLPPVPWAVAAASRNPPGVTPCKVLSVSCVDSTAHPTFPPVC